MQTSGAWRGARYLGLIGLDGDTFGARVRSTRQMRGLKLGDVARAVGIEEKNLCRLERWGPSPGCRLSTIERLAKALDVDPAALAFGKRGGICAKCETFSEEWSELTERERRRIRRIKRRKRRARERR